MGRTAAPGFSASIGKRNVVEVDFVESMTSKRICIQALRMLLAQEVRENTAGKRICIQACHSLTLENIERGFTPLETIADNYENLVLPRTRCRRSTAATSPRASRTTGPARPVWPSCRTCSFPSRHLRVQPRVRIPHLEEKRRSIRK